MKMRSVSDRIKILATLGVGFSPVLPGTLGSLWGILLFWVLHPLPWPLYWLSVIAFTFFAVWVADRALPSFAGSARPGDPRAIIIDEVAGYLWSAGILSHLGFWNPTEGTLTFLILSFGMFRLFDIVKFGPVRWAERKFRGGLGIVLDDVAAGILGGIAAILFTVLYPLVLYAVGAGF